MRVEEKKTLAHDFLQIAFFFISYIWLDTKINKKNLTPFLFLQKILQKIHNHYVPQRLFPYHQYDYFYPSQIQFSCYSFSITFGSIISGLGGHRSIMPQWAQ